ncbi:glycosyltransferase family 32 protein [Comamonas sp. MYb396]|uniref:glycosyltransferase family 32 protein n=1 Tax=Comamonas sp. MYb396 TaxID=2745302 RepID=UPI00309B1267
MIGIPKNLGHIWIGPRPAPLEWMNTWRDHHPDWSYTLYDNDFLSNFHFQTQKQIEEYLKRGQYAGVADLMRLEILYENGGLLAPADSICLRNTQNLFPQKRAYTVYENEFVRGELVSPIQACEPGNEFVKTLIEQLKSTDPNDLDEPWISTGNLFMAQMIKKLNPEITIFPSQILIPIHFTGVLYEGSDKPYAIQLFSTTQNTYKKNNVISRAISYISRVRMKKYNRKKLAIVKSKKLEEGKKRFLNGQ